MKRRHTTRRWAGLDAHRPSPWREPKRCIFCGSSDPLTREHLFSNWTRRFVPRTTKDYTSVRATSYHDRTDFVLVKRQGDIRDSQIKCVCERVCNNGWMRKLENAARDIMIPLIKGEEVRLTPADQRILAGWAAMKAMVGEFADSDSVTTHHMQRRRMMRMQLPPNNTWGIWIGRFVWKDWPVRWLSVPFLLLPDRIVAKRSHRRATYYNSHATTHVIGELFIQIIRTPMPNFIRRWSFPLPQGVALFRIWPPAPFSIRWPGGPLDDFAADTVAAALRDFMARVEADRLSLGNNSSLDRPSSGRWLRYRS
jgi:hypothetical protein